MAKSKKGVIGRRTVRQSSPVLPFLKWASQDPSTNPACRGMAADAPCGLRENWSLQGRRHRYPRITRRGRQRNPVIVSWTTFRGERLPKFTCFHALQDVWRAFSWFVAPSGHGGYGPVGVFSGKVEWNLIDRRPAIMVDSKITVLSIRSYPNR